MSDWRSFVEIIVDECEPSLRGRPKYLLASHEVPKEFQCAGNQLAYTSRTLDLQLAPITRSWSGRSFSCVLDVGRHKTRHDIVASTIHELGHWLSDGGPVGGCEDYREVQQAADVISSWQTDITPKPQICVPTRLERKWANHGLRFVRAACHASYRVQRVLRGFRPESVRFATGYYPKNYNERLFMSMLGSELEQMQNRPIREILQSPAPSSFSKWWIAAAKSHPHIVSRRFERRIVRSLAVDSKLAVVVASEGTPIETEHGRTYLQLDGMESRPKRDRIPIINADLTGESVRAIVGSISSMRVMGSELKGVATFASDNDSQVIRSEFAKGKRSSLELVVDVKEGVELKSGEFYGNFDGPAIVATRWIPLRANTKADHG
jgi:hypothetical protein